MRTGNEPNTARSPLGLRLVFAGFGLLAGLVGTAGMLAVGDWGWATAFGALAVIALVDLAVITVRIRQGPHFQPGPSIPPYQPPDPQPRPVKSRAGLSRPLRIRLYFALMGSCLLLFVLDGLWLRQVSTGLAVAVGVVAAFLPPVAVIIANAGRAGGDQSPPP